MATDRIKKVIKECISVSELTDKEFKRIWVTACPNGDNHYYDHDSEAQILDAIGADKATAYLAWKADFDRKQSEAAHNARKNDKRPAAPARDSYQRITLTRLKDIEEQEPDWLINGYLARGEINILAGDGGAGKSFVWVAIAAAVSNGIQPQFIDGNPFVDKRDQEAAHE